MSESLRSKLENSCVQPEPSEIKAASTQPICLTILNFICVKYCLSTKQNVWENIWPKYWLHRGSIFGPIKIGCVDAT